MMFSVHKGVKRKVLLCLLGSGVLVTHGSAIPSCSPNPVKQGPATPRTGRLKRIPSDKLSEAVGGLKLTPTRFEGTALFQARSRASPSVVAFPLSPTSGTINTAAGRWYGHTLPGTPFTTKDETPTKQLGLDEATLQRLEFNWEWNLESLWSKNSKNPIPYLKRAKQNGNLDWTSFPQKIGIYRLVALRKFALPNAVTHPKVGLRKGHIFQKGQVLYIGKAGLKNSQAENVQTLLSRLQQHNSGTQFVDKVLKLDEVNGPTKPEGMSKNFGVQVITSDCFAECITNQLYTGSDKNIETENTRILEGYAPWDLEAIFLTDYWKTHVNGAGVNIMPALNIRKDFRYYLNRADRLHKKHTNALILACKAFSTRVDVNRDDFSPGTQKKFFLKKLQPRRKSGRKASKGKGCVKRKSRSLSRKRKRSGRKRTTGTNGGFNSPLRKRRPTGKKTPWARQNMPQSRNFHPRKTRRRRPAPSSRSRSPRRGQRPITPVRGCRRNRKTRRLIARVDSIPTAAA